MTDLETKVVEKPVPQANEHLDACIDLLAEALTDRFVDEARREVASELDVPEECSADVAPPRLDRDAWSSRGGQEAQP